MPANLPRFHLALPVTDLNVSYDFFVRLFDCNVGRRSERWIDFNFFGHQLTLHLAPESEFNASTSPVDNKQVPVRHFGVILDWQQWQALADKLVAEQQTFLIDPYVRFAGEPGEQATFFILDPSGNGLEFKAFKQDRQVFATS